MSKLATWIVDKNHGLFGKTWRLLSCEYNGTSRISGYMEALKKVWGHSSQIDLKGIQPWIPWVLFSINLILLIGNLGEVSLWSDESKRIATVHGLYINELVKFLQANEVHLPLYYLLLKFILLLFGLNIWVLRAVSVLFASMSFYRMLVLSEENLSERSNVLTLFFFSSSYLVMSLGREVGPYALLLYLSTEFYIFGLRLAKSKNISIKNLGIYGVLFFLLTNTHYFGVLLAFAFTGLLSVYRWRIYKEKNSFFLLALFLSFIPHLPQFLKNLFEGHDWRSKNVLVEANHFIQNQFFSHWLVVAMLFIFLGVWVFRFLKNKVKVEPIKILMFTSTIICLGFAFIYSYALNPIVEARYLIITFPMLILFASSFVSWGIFHDGLRFLTVSLMLTLSVRNMIVDKKIFEQPQYDDLKSVSQGILKHYQNFGNNSLYLAVNINATNFYFSGNVIPQLIPLKASVFKSPQGFLKVDDPSMGSVFLSYTLSTPSKEMKDFINKYYRVVDVGHFKNSGFYYLERK